MTHQWIAYPRQGQDQLYAYAARVVHARLWYPGDTTVLPRPGVAREVSSTVPANSRSDLPKQISCAECAKEVKPSSEIVVEKSTPGVISKGYHAACFGPVFEVVPDWNLHPGLHDSLQLPNGMSMGFSSRSSGALYVNSDDQANLGPEVLPKVRDARFESAWAKFDRGLEHERACVKEVSELMRRRLLVDLEFREGKSKSQTRTRTEVFARLADEVPATHWATLVGDAVANYRSALDHLMWRLVEIEGNSPNGMTQFPINLEERPSGLVDLGVGGSALDLLRLLQPYTSTNVRDTQHVLAALKELNNADKHRQLYFVAALADGMTVHYEKLLEESINTVRTESLIGKEYACAIAFDAPSNFDVVKQVEWRFAPMVETNLKMSADVISGLRSISSAVGRVLRTFSLTTQ